MGIVLDVVRGDEMRSIDVTVLCPGTNRSRSSLWGNRSNGMMVAQW